MNHSYQDGVLIVGLGQQGTTFSKKLRDNGVSIHGTDIDPVKMESFGKAFPNAQLYTPESDGSILLPPGMSTIIASNTPDHKRAIAERVGNGVKHILTEKPLALNLEQTKSIITLVQKNKVDLYTALLIRFSPVVDRLRGFMMGNNLIMTTGEVNWGKNRIGNSRPTAGDLEDEAVHGMDILFLMASLNQDIEQMNIIGTLGFDNFVSSEVQRKMHNIDSSYPLTPNSSSRVITEIETTHTRVQTLLQSSFVAPTERRNITIQLASKDNPKTPLYSVRMDFDKRLPEGGVKDLLQILDLQNPSNIIPILEAPTDKMGDQTKAWLDAIRGIQVDSRLATTSDALRVAQWTQGVIDSSKTLTAIEVHS